MMFKYLYGILFINMFLSINAIENYVVNKKGVRYVFELHEADKFVNNFVKNEFARWENETFDVFDQVKNPTGIAIDLGAWIGTTAIWLSKNFSHVIAVDADVNSLESLKRNLNASECFNVTICSQPVLDTSKDVCFGPRGVDLNESISCVKENVNSSNDYYVQGITFKQLIDDFVYKNDLIKDEKISFIKCDIEGGEENILEDVLCFAYQNKVSVYMSFHLDWWKHKNIADFECLFKLFKTNCPCLDLIGHLRRNPFGSLLFEPLDNV